MIKYTSRFTYNSMQGDCDYSASSRAITRFAVARIVVSRLPMQDGYSGLASIMIAHSQIICQPKFRALRCRKMFRLMSWNVGVLGDPDRHCIVYALICSCQSINQDRFLDLLAAFGSESFDVQLSCGRCRDTSNS